MNDESALIFATKRVNEDFVPDEIIKDFSILDTVEYADTPECQIWEYPSGKIFNIVPDREVEEKDLYSVPSQDKWLPTLAYDHMDVDKVSRAFMHLRKARSAKKQRCEPEHLMT